ncbi:unnamed protein product [Cladocopium goreaui]|uniref:Ubiquitin-like domain-containing protein n=1 Tax=Cladocopium goreaui TaxID=2562237 RepID=A0A9P1G1L4_9DINO|nr:unnamed protein product [Cladocopium goreaui]
MVKGKLSDLLGCPAVQLTLLIGTTPWSDDKLLREVFSGSDGQMPTLSVIKSEGWVPLRMQALKAKVEKRGKVQSDPAEGGLSADAALPEGLEFPSALRLLLQHGAKWTFGAEGIPPLCLYAATREVGNDIFGDEECKADWMEEHGEDSCAGDDWICIGESSEFDYFFVNLRKTSPNFGMVKHIVNNCDEDPDETGFSEAPFDRFLDIVESFAEHQAVDEDDCEPLHSFQFRALQAKKKKRLDVASVARAQPHID